MGKDLIGDLTVQDTWTRNEVFIKFDGGRALYLDTYRNSVTNGWLSRLKAWMFVNAGLVNLQYN